MYEVKITKAKGSFTINTKVSEVNELNLSSLPNPCYKDIIQHYSHLKGIQMNDNNEKTELLIHVIRIGNRGESVTEYTEFGGAIVSGGRETTKIHKLLTRGREADYAGLCQLDVLGLEERKSNYKGKIFHEFKDHLRCNQEGWYETCLF